MGRKTTDTKLHAQITGLFDLDGKSALVVGGYGSLGGAISWGLVSRGARVAVAGRSADKAAAFAGGLEAAGHEALGLALDATSVGAIDDGVDRVAGAFGAIDILVNCVGINIQQGILEVTEEVFDDVYAANLKSSMFLGQAVARRQVEAGRGGKQLHMLSVSSQRGFFGRGYSAYCSMKGALIMLVRQHALELAPHDIQVNGVAPGYVKSEMIRQKMADPKVAAEIIAAVPARRLAEPMDVVGPSLFFVSPAAGFVTGQVIYVDGGMSANR